MNLKTCLLSILLVFSIAAQAQDKIYKKNGDIINSNVKAVTNNTVTYKRSDNQDGPEYVILKKEVAKIVYQNGTTDVFDGNNTKETSGHSGKTGASTKKYGDNILSIIPGAYTVSVDGTMNDPGIGICYERLLDRRGHISFTLPVLINFLSSKDFNNYNYNYVYFVPGTNVPNTNGYTSLSFMPGIRFYPARNDKKVRYSLGASFFTLFGREPYYFYDPSTNSTGDYHYAVYGLMISNSVNISASKHLYVAIDLNTGMPISDNRFSGKETIDALFAPMMQFVFKVGYRF